ncbi:GatB/YqeY domain-containing protein [Flavobacterium sp.]|uniref:GatB/YqeY domain-containing protein n=1 Tax=Flavobacterium sp. TaxID=239 RepID=UPI004048380F
MSLEAKIMDQMKTAMKAKDTVALEALRAIKAAIIIAKTETGSGDVLAEADEVKMLQRLVKMRKDSAEIYTTQGRTDLAEPELAQIAVIEQFLPAQLSEAEIETIIARIISETGASGIASMGKVMGLASAEIGGQAEGKVISGIVKKLLV